MPKELKITEQNIDRFKTIYEDYEINPGFYEQHERRDEFIKVVDLYKNHLKQEEIKNLPIRPDKMGLPKDINFTPSENYIPLYKPPAPQQKTIQAMNPLQAGTVIDESDGSFAVKERKMGTLEQMRNGFISGSYGLVDIVGGHLIRSGLNEELGRQMRDFSKRIRKDYDAPLLGKTWDEEKNNLRWYLVKGAEMLPMLTALIPTAVGGGAIGGSVATFLGAGRVAIGVTSAVTSALASRPLESKIEAISVYNEMIDSGETEQIAEEAATEVYSKNMTLIGMDAAQYALAFAKVPAPLRGSMASWIKKVGLKAVGFAAGSATEGYEEVIQNYFIDLGKASVQGQASPELIEALKLSSPEQREAFVLGTMAGAGFQATGTILSAKDKKVFEKEELDRIIEEQVEINESNREETVEKPEEKTKTEKPSETQPKAESTTAAKPAEETKEEKLKESINKGLEEAGMGIEKAEKIESGQPYKAEVYRGVKDRGPTDEGLYGKGTYFTTNEEYAKQYGEVKKSTVELKNPFVIKNQEEANAFFNEVTRPAREKALSENKSIQEADEFAAQEARKYLEDQGYDGIVAQNIIERGDEVVVFEEQKAEPKEPLTTPEITEEITPYDLSENLDNIYSEYRKLDEELSPQIKEKKAELSDVKSRTKEATNKRKKLRKEIEGLENQIGEAQQEADDANFAMFENFDKKLREIIKKEVPGISEDDIDGLVTDIQLDITERPGIEHTWKMKIGDVIKDDINYYKEQNNLEEPAKSPEKAEKSAEPTKTPKKEETAEKSKLADLELKKETSSKPVQRQDVPIKEIQTRPEEFQGRRRPYSEKSVARIIKAVEEGTFNWNQFDDLLLWETDKGNFVLSGHSRLEAANRLVEKGYEEFENLPVRLFKGTKAEAEEAAKISNKLGTAEALLDGANNFRKMRLAGETKTKMIEEAQRLEGKNAQTVLALSYLSKNGSVEQALEAFEDVGSKDARDVLSMATWIGKVKERFPELTRSHETEMFTYLQKTFNDKFKRYEDFNNFVGAIVDRHTEFGVFDGEPLNFKNVKSVSSAELEYNQQKEEARAAVSEARRKLNEKRKQFAASEGATKEAIAQALMPYEQELVVAEMQYTKILEKDADVKANLRLQQDIFSIAKEEKPSKEASKLQKSIEATENDLKNPDLTETQKENLQNSLTILKKLLKEEGGYVDLKAVPGLKTLIEKINGRKLSQAEIGEIAKKIENRDFTFANEEFEQGFQEGMKSTEPSFTKQADTILGKIKNKVTREFEEIPKGGEFAKLTYILRKIEKQRGVASYKAVKNIDTIIKGLKKSDYRLFVRKVVLEDLVESANRGEALPFGLDETTAKTELARLNKQLEKNKSVQQALDNRKEYWAILREQYSAAMGNIGLNVNNIFERENYFRHIVLDYAKAERLLGVSKKLNTPTGRSFLKERKGSTLSIKTDYLQAEHGVMAQMLHDIEIAKAINDIKAEYDIKPQIIEKLKEGEKWQDKIPEGYTAWQPQKGNRFYLAHTVPESIASELFENKLLEIGINASDLNEVLALAGKREQYVIKKEIANTLDNLVPNKKSGWPGKVLKYITRKWKVWTLISPRRYLRYNFRNMTGDAEAVFVGNPKGFKKSLQAATELYHAYTGEKVMTENLQDWFERGGFETTLQAQEIEDINRLKPFLKLHNSKSGPLKKVWNAYWKAARGSTDFRESILRYGNYLSYLEQLNANNGVLENYGASDPEEVNALTDNKDKAFMLSNDLLGAYDRVGIFGKDLREHTIPFWSWQEVNAKRYVQFFKNAANNNQLAATVGRKLGAKTAFTAIKIGKFAIKATGFWALLQTWNNLKFPDEEEELTEQERNTLHIILGRDKDGGIITFPRIGMLGDFLEWFGLDAAPQNISDFIHNKKTLKEIAVEMAESPVNKIVQGINPIFKLPVEILGRQALFPDVFERYTIRDRGIHIARSVGLENEYREIAGKPAKPYTKSLKNILFYTTDPLQTAYSKNFMAKRKYLKKIGKAGEGYFITDKSNALYNYKQAIRLKDADAAAKYFVEYLRILGTIDPNISLKKINQNIAKALQSMNPLGSMSEADQKKFVLQLNDEEIKNLVKAIRYYDEVLLANADQELYSDISKEILRLLKE